MTDNTRSTLIFLTDGTDEITNIWSETGTRSFLELQLHALYEDDAFDGDEEDQMEYEDWLTFQSYLLIRTDTPEAEAEVQKRIRLQNGGFITFQERDFQSYDELIWK